MSNKNFFDVEKIRADFPILNTSVYGKPLIYLDNAATTQMPVCVMDAVMEHYRTQNGNVHRGIHYLSERSTSAMENVRKKTADFLHADPYEIVFTSGATDSLNLVAGGFALPRLASGKKVITTQMEHHSNYVPWQQAALRTGAEFVEIPTMDDGSAIDLTRLEKELDENTVMLSVTAVSNVTGAALPLKRIISMAHKKGVPVCVDASQAMRHGMISGFYDERDLKAGDSQAQQYRVMDVKDLDCEFMAFSAHKMMGPAGVGVLYGKKEFLEKLSPVRFGGGMVDIVNAEKTTFADTPLRFEAGTPNYPGIIAFGTALDYLETIGLDTIADREQQLSDYLERGLRRLPHVNVLGGTGPKKSVVSVIIDGIHPYDMAEFLDKFGVAVRSGSHCAQPFVRTFGCDAVLRFSIAFYNTEEEIDMALEYMEKCIGILSTAGR